MRPGDNVRFIGCSEAQHKWGNHSGDPAALEVGRIYKIHSLEEHSCHTKYYLNGVQGSFNSVCFEEVPV